MVKDYSKYIILKFTQVITFKWEFTLVRDNFCTHCTGAPIEKNNTGKHIGFLYRS